MLRVPCISLSNKRKKTVMILKKENSLLTDKKARNYSM
jgi:hypothetical protein